MNANRITLTRHAIERWSQRFAHRFPFGLHAELYHAKRVKRRRLRAINVRYDPQFRYYCTNICVFVIRSHNDNLVTVLERNR